MPGMWSVPMDPWLIPREATTGSVGWKMERNPLSPRENQHGWLHLIGGRVPYLYIYILYIYYIYIIYIYICIHICTYPHEIMISPWYPLDVDGWAIHIYSLFVLDPLDVLVICWSETMDLSRGYQQGLLLTCATPSLPYVYICVCVSI